MRGRGLGDPLLVACDGAPGIIKAIETCFPRSTRQRCLFHRMSNLAAKISREDAWPDFRERARAACQAPSRAIARDLARNLSKDFEREFPTAVSCFRDDFEACIAHLRMPVRHRKAIRTTNLLERLFGEERRRMKVILNAWGERPVLKLMFAAMTQASEKWRPIGITGFERRQMTAVRKELDEECEKANGPVQGLKTEQTPQEYPALLGLDRRKSRSRRPTDPDRRRFRSPPPRARVKNRGFYAGHYFENEPSNLILHIQRGKNGVKTDNCQRHDERKDQHPKCVRQL